MMSGNLLTVLLLLIFSINGFSATGDTTKIKVHDRVDMTWYGNYDRWGVFPDGSKTYHKILMHYTMGCPSSGCSDWDYTTQIELLFNTGQLDSTISSIDTISTTPLIIDTSYSYFPVKIPYELARVITPYGGYMRQGSNGYNNNWKHVFTFDVTDFAHLLKDSVQLRAFYDGWSSGFSVTLDFDFIEGTPARNVFHVENLYKGSWAYNNSAAFETDHLPARTINVPANTSTSMIRIIPSGHGFDNNTSCAEFCPRSFFLKVNNANIASQSMWRDDCGKNPIFPQGGTWLYDRANWCPGSRTISYDYQANMLTPGQSNTIDLDIQSYTWAGTQAPSYIISAQLFHYGAPNFTVDAGIDQIISPSVYDDYKRMNPICDQAEILVKNYGSTTLTTMSIKYRIAGGSWLTHNWTGSLPFMESTSISLPFFQIALEQIALGQNLFEVEIATANGIVDNYAYNNKNSSTFMAAPIHQAKVEFIFRTNNKANETTWTLTDLNGNLLHKNPSFMQSNTVYKDTFNLDAGCYRLTVTDAAGNGLAWWANNDGSGYARLKIPGGSNIKNWADFGSVVEYEFIVTDSQTSVQAFESEDIINIFPNPAKEFCYIDLDFASPRNVNIELLDLTGRVVYNYNAGIISDKQISLNLNEFSKGIYLVKIISGEKVTTKKIIIDK
jgi:hypothetical protein